ncbi:GyrI-like domain-containing protein [Psychrobacillus sp. FJAT-21963]|uniref:GyrI-like domain-containing protein n=1 Tax=Psychrobacillus sp. FJAT-21963 TaxID=1712028 RepID=UPI0006FC8832|nr:GyrI-like domain-containing protein [Psychrobacillus sp. FJAT-21963]KQL34287.1 transcription activator [Psychrobacillus sp. FJAT-21963]
MTKQFLQNPSIECLDEIKLVGFRILCDGTQYVNEIPKVANQLNERLSEIKNVLNPFVQFGAFVVDSHSENQDGYWVCMQVKEYEEIPEGMVTLTVPPQKYIVWRHKGPNLKIRDAYERLHSWMEANGYERQMDKWHLERFHSWNDTENVDVELLDTVKNE